MKKGLARSKVTRQDQTSVPFEVRKRFGIKAGAELGWYEEEGRLIVDLARTHTLADVRAVLTVKVTIEPVPEPKDSIKAHVAEKFKRAGR